MAEYITFKKTPEAVSQFTLSWPNAVDTSEWSLGLPITTSGVVGSTTNITVSGGIIGNTYCGLNTVDMSGIIDSASFSVYIV